MPAYLPLLWAALAAIVAWPLIALWRQRRAADPRHLTR